MIDQPQTVTDLAALLQVNRRRIAKWRELEQAPDSLDLAAWRAWLHATGRTKLVTRLDESAAPLTGVAPETAAAATIPGAPADDLDATDDTGAPQVPMPASDAPPAAWEKYYKARGNRQTALNAERQARRDARDLIEADEVKALLQAMAAGMLDALGDSIWLALRPHLDGVPDTLRKTLRTAHDQGVLAMRGRLTVVLRDKFTAITNPPAKPA